jgi:serine/threonine-protein kinase Chk2
LISSPPQDTQERSQFTYETRALTDDVKDEEEEGVWGYLMPLNQQNGRILVLRTRGACPISDESLDIGKIKKRKDPASEEEEFEQSKIEGVASRGYLIGRHPECGKWCATRPGWC